jgi:hypothetical protein
MKCDKRESDSRVILGQKSVVISGEVDSMEFIGYLRGGTENDR